MDLTEFTKIPRVLGVGITTYDGFIIDSQVVHGYDAEKVGAVVAKVVNQIRKSFETETGVIILYTENIVILAKAKNVGILFVIADKDANLGLIKIRCERG